MAACAKCGAALASDGAGFCPACGAPVGAAASAQPVSAPLPPSPPPAYSVAAPPRSGNTVLKVVLIVVAVVVGLGVLGAAAVGYIGYKAVHNGAISVGDSSMTSADLGVDLYPSATPVEHGAVRLKMAGHSMVTATYKTSDPPEQVVSFYKGKLGDSAIVNESDRGTTLQVVRSNDDDHLVITVKPDANGGTAIAIVHQSGS